MWTRFKRFSSPLRAAPKLYALVAPKYAAVAESYQKAQGAAKQSR